MLKQFKYLLASIGFLSIIPIGIDTVQTEEDMAKTAAYFPAAGFAIGAFGLVLAVPLDRVMPLAAVNALLIFYFAIVTGALHLDALADTVDGLGGGSSVSRRLEIMRDGAVGPMGVVAITLALLLKFSFLGGLAGSTRLLAIAAVPALARWPMVWMARRLPAARPGGLGHIFAEHVGGREVIVSALISIMIGAGISRFLGWEYLLMLPIVLLIAVAGVAANKAFIGGITGDTLGAMVEISEILLFLTVGIISHYA